MPLDIPLPFRQILSKLKDSRPSTDGQSRVAACFQCGNISLEARACGETTRLSCQECGLKEPEITLQAIGVSAVSSAVTERAERKRAAAIVSADFLMPTGVLTPNTVNLPTSHEEPAEKEAEGIRVGEYIETAGGIWHIKETRDGTSRKLLMNFTARIISQTIEDDGAETSLLLTLEVKRKGFNSRFSVSASGFSTLNWVIEQLGAEAILSPGQMVRDHARTAIQMLSGDIPTERVFRHTGWSQVEGEKWTYLHGGGSIGGKGSSVKLEGSLSRYVLPSAPTGEALREAVSATLSLLALAPPEVICPLFASIWRSAIAPCDFSLFLTGLTGVFKSELAALAQSFFGSGFTGRTLPADWSSTDNALEALAFQAKDTILVIDEYVPRGAASDVQKLRAKADRVLRAQGNGASRQRLRNDGTSRPPKPPRGLIICTGEDLPVGQSLQARIIALELKTGDVDRAKLTLCQKNARAGLYAGCMAAFLEWVAPKYETVKQELFECVLKDREQFTRHGHLRAPEALANLYYGLGLFARFLTENGLKTKAEADQWLSDGKAALLRVGEAQSAAQSQHDPAYRFLELLCEALSSGRAHLANEVGDHPDALIRLPLCGWRYEEGRGTGESGQWRPQGRRIGFLVGENVYLLPEASYTAAREMGEAGGEGLSLTSSSMWRRLKEKGLLVTEGKRETNFVRRRLSGETMKVLQLSYPLGEAISTDIPAISDISHAH